MKLESVRGLKAELFNGLLRTDRPRASSGRLGTFSIDGFETPPQVALGIYRRGPGEDYGLALRIQNASDADAQFLDRVQEITQGEVDIRYIGPVTPLSGSATPWHRRRLRPLRMGLSIGHPSITAGTLGAFVRDRLTGDNLVLSNNHVLAAEDTALPGDPIVQPGTADNGSAPTDTVAVFSRSRALTVSGNLVDAAVAAIPPDQIFRPRMLVGPLRLAGQRMTDIDVGDRVYKLGRSTGPTRGVVTAIELDAVAVDYNRGRLTFDGQFEIEGMGSQAFAQGGDSGSLILDSNLQACGLLFAGGSSGGANGMGLTYANPITMVLDLLHVDLI